MVGCTLLMISLLPITAFVYGPNTTNTTTTDHELGTSAPPQGHQLGTPAPPQGLQLSTPAPPTTEYTVESTLTVDSSTSLTPDVMAQLNDQMNRGIGFVMDFSTAIADGLGFETTLERLGSEKVKITKIDSVGEEKLIVDYKVIAASQAEADKVKETLTDSEKAENFEKKVVESLEMGIFQYWLYWDVKEIISTSCQVGQGESDSSKILGRFNEHSKIGCQALCSSVAECTNIDYTQNSQSDACRLYSSNTPQLGVGGNDSRQYCRVVTARMSKRRLRGKRSTLFV